MVNDKIERENFFKLIYKGEKRRNPSKEIYGKMTFLKVRKKHLRVFKYHQESAKGER